jgi:hypothetical protein
MNRLAPLIVRASAQPAPAWLTEPPPLPEASAPALAGDLRAFVTAWLGGLVFFGTMIA